MSPSRTDRVSGRIRPAANSGSALLRGGDGRLSDLLQEHVARFNAGVHTGDWGPMLEQFDDAAEMEFRGVPVGPFVGKTAIGAAYRERPPDDQMRVLERRERKGRIEARYAWLAEPEIAAGEMVLVVKDGLIERLLVTFDRGVTWG
jgi:steroid delta-isomerase